VGMGGILCHCQKMNRKNELTHKQFYLSFGCEVEPEGGR
jgi:hypothetical protein